MAAKPKTYCIKFFAGVNADSIGALMTAVDNLYNRGVKKFTLLISSQGGDVFQGLSAYNYLRGVPMEVTTHNFGTAESIGAVLYCAGTKRYCVPHARFLLHGLAWTLNGRYEEPVLEERLKSLKVDMANVAQVIADTVGKSKDEVFQHLVERTALDAQQGMEYGLVHEIRSSLFGPNTEIISIPAPKAASPSQ